MTLNDLQSRLRPDSTFKNDTATWLTRGSPIPLNQERFLLAEELTEANYGLPVFFRVRGLLDVNALYASFVHLVERHAVLRSVFTRNDHGYRVLIRPELSGWFERLDLRDRSEEEAIAAVVEWSDQPWDLWAGPLFRCSVAELPQGDYAVSFVLHHIIGDGVSLAILTRELSACYAAFAAGRDPSLLPVGRPYYDVVRDWDSPQQMDRDDRFWRRTLAGAKPGLTIPLDRDRRSSRTYRKEVVERTVPTRIVGAIKRIATQQEVTTFTVFASVFGLLLSRYSGETDVAFGLQTSGRQGRNDLEATIGLLSNVLVLRARPEGDSSLGEYVKRVRADLLKALEHQRRPYHLVLKSTGVRPAVDINWFPLQPELELGDLEVKKQRWAELQSDFDVNLYCEYVPEGVLLRGSYDPTLYDAAHLELVLGQFERVLEQAAANPSRPLREFELGGGPERALLPDPASQLSAAPPAAIYSRFREQAARSPTAVAVESAAGRWRYGELERVSNRLAHRLIDWGVSEGDTVAILADRDPALIYAVLGVAKAGAAFLIVDSAYPDARVRAFLATAKPAAMLLVGEVEAPPRWGEGAEQPRVMWLPSRVRAARRALRGFSDEPPAVEVQPEAVAYLTFTSGSTGQPKCIETSHAPLAHFVQWHERQFGLRGDDRFSMLSGLSHDPVLRDIFTPLSIGARLCIPAQKTLLDPPRLWAWLRSQAVTVSHLTPALGQVLAAGRPEGGRMPALRYLFWGGATLTGNVLAALEEALPKARHVNFYGATETPQVMAYHEVQTPFPAGAVPLGCGINNVQILVVGEAGQLAGIDELGEIYIRTPYLSRGYRNDAEQTRQRFIPNPFTDNVLDRVYRTGDFGRYLYDGSVSFVGRFDDQVKVRGFRVELGDVASHLQTQPGVASAMVRHRVSPTGADQLVAYYVPKPNGETTPGSLMEAMRQGLPSYMVPTFFVQLDRWPLLPNGKVDGAALPEPGADDAPTAIGYTAPATPRERELAELWASVLGLPSVGVNEDFFSVGGDSLTAIRVVYKMTRLGIDERVCRGLFQGRTVRQIAQQLDGDPAAAAQDAPSQVAFLDGSAAAQTTLLLNLIRGLLVLIIVAGHWMPGFLERLPEQFTPYGRLLTPLFNFATPGFAIVFGMSMGYIYYPMFLKDRKQVDRILRLGSLILLASIVILSAIRLAEYALRSDAISWTGFTNTLYSVLTYYFLAVLTAPLWFRVIAFIGRPIVATLGLALLMYGAYRAAVELIFPYEFEGFVQLAKLVAVAKFSYFNMSVGALGGLAAGLHLHRHLDGPRLSLTYSLLALPLLTIGATVGVVADGYEQWLEVSKSVPFWKWLFYGGLVCILVVAMRLVTRHYASLTLVGRAGVRWVGVLGQCALPVFLLHHIVLDFKSLLELAGVPDMMGIAVVLGLFFGLTYTLMRKVYNLYYGSIAA